MGVPMYERFTDRARKVMQLANQEAQRFNHEYIGTEHILLGLVKEGTGLGAIVLEKLNVDLRRIRLEIERIVQFGPDMVTMGKLPQTPRAKKVIEYSIEEVRNLNHNYVGTEHLLLGLFREDGGVASQILRNLGLTLDRIREEVHRALALPMETSRGQGPLWEATTLERIAKRTGDLAARVLAQWRSKRGAAATELPNLPEEVLRELDELAERFDVIDQQKEAAIAEQDFERAASLKDQADTLMKRFQALFRAPVISEESREYELLVGQYHEDGSPIALEVFHYIEKQCRDRFTTLTRSKRQVIGELKVGLIGSP